MTLLDYIKPYDIPGEMVRYGNKRDGGYVVNKDFLKFSNTLYTYGVCDDITFELDFLNNNPEYTVHLYDHTISNFPYYSNKNIFSHKEGLSLDTTANCDCVLNHILKNNDQDKKIFLKMDIESHELHYFLNRDLSKFNNIVQLIAEFHWIGSDANFTNAIARVCEYFYPIHVHGNNYGQIKEISGTRFSTISELTFINKLYVNDLPIHKKGKYPREGLDYCNGGSHEDWSTEF